MLRLKHETMTGPAARWAHLEGIIIHQKHLLQALAAGQAVQGLDGVPVLAPHLHVGLRGGLGVLPGEDERPVAEQGP